MERISLREARVGDRVPTRLLGPQRLRRLDATALVIPGTPRPDDYLGTLTAAAEAFAVWDGRIHVADPDGQATHRLLVVDRYRQVYAVHDATEATALPGTDELTEWFRFLSTACPECGVLDEALLAGPTP
jgi:hypothetical protein